MKKAKKSFLKYVDPALKLSPLHQALHIALRDAYYGFALHKKAVETFGFVAPFATVLEAKQQHITELTSLLVRYEVPLPKNEESACIMPPMGLLEAYELGVAFEIETIQRITHLLPYVATYPDAQEMFFRLQAASYNTFLPTFRSHVAQQTSTPATQGLSQEEMMAKVEEWRGMAQRIAAGDTNALGEMFQGINISLMGGMLLGGVAASLLSQMNTPEEPESL